MSSSPSRLWIIAPLAAVVTHREHRRSHSPKSTKRSLSDFGCPLLDCGLGSWGAARAEKSEFLAKLVWTIVVATGVRRHPTSQVRAGEWRARRDSNSRPPGS
jgi:hypothetical protein